ncbi:zinc-binding alcohol dehydrogenase [Vineibacter terrae]|uniref:Zinc-binding alcohol dehydrogenase n=1 Tax=Vineibacter terrae TaxID=2586908 RepID=A0A5C8P9P9_9HYPH|nr:zinc-binding alcohol dehydrogenase [Vineibacter terrae]
MDRASGHDTVTRALWYAAPGQAILRTETIPAPRPDEVLVQTHYSALSRGTESLVFAGAVPEAEHHRMRAPFQAGAFPFPVKYGYAAVGTVMAGPHDLLGRAVFALHPHQSAFVVPAAAVVALPAGLPPRRAVLAANMETALNALWDAAVLPGSRIAVVGIGTVGALVAWLAGQIPGTEVIAVDIRPEQAAIAGALGVGFATPGNAPIDCDLVFHASATPEGLATAVAAAGDEATIIELSWYGDRTVAATLGGAFHSRRLRLLASQVGSVAPSMRARWPHRRRLAQAIALLADPRLEVLLEPDVAFEDLPGALPALLGPGGAAMCQVVTYP